ncbi:MAG: hypothetical protein DAHOPDDO_02560 [Ignavibacteriaceae bacterium]|nr:hypothetical protein [Ignavibacteriaceae bacterium]
MPTNNNFHSSKKSCETSDQNVDLIAHQRFIIIINH